MGMHGVAPATVGRALGVSKDTIDRYVEGARRPSWPVAIGLAALFRLKVDDLSGDPGETMEKAGALWASAPIRSHGDRDFRSDFQMFLLDFLTQDEFDVYLKGPPGGQMLPKPVSGQRLASMQTLNQEEGRRFLRTGWIDPDRSGWRRKRTSAWMQ